jgi:hypothetical protein
MRRAAYGGEQPRRTLFMSMRTSTKQIASRILSFSELRRLDRVEGRVSARGRRPDQVRREHCARGCVSGGEQEEGEGGGRAAGDELLDAHYVAEWRGLTECGRAGVRREGHRRRNARRVTPTKQSPIRQTGARKMRARGEKSARSREKRAECACGRERRDGDRTERMSARLPQGERARVLL